MRDVQAEIEKRGASLVVVGNGNVQQADAFAREEGLTFELLTDPKRLSYQEAGLKRSLMATFSLQTAKNGVRALKEGFRQSGVRGDAFQQGGAFVIAPGHRVLLEQRSEDSGDHVDPKALVSALPSPEGG